MKKGFSMVTAIMFMVLVSFVAVSVIRNSHALVNFTALAYLNEQAELIVEGAKQIAVDEWLRSNPSATADSADSGIYQLKSSIIKDDGTNNEKETNKILAQVASTPAGTVYKDFEKVQVFYYPNDKSPQFRILIKYMFPRNPEKLTKFDRNMVVAKIMVSNYWCYPKGAELNPAQNRLVYLDELGFCTNEKAKEKFELYGSTSDIAHVKKIIFYPISN